MTRKNTLVREFNRYRRMDLSRFGKAFKTSRLNRSIKKECIKSHCASFKFNKCVSKNQNIAQTKKNLENCFKTVNEKWSKKLGKYCQRSCCIGSLCGRIEAFTGGKFATQCYNSCLKCKRKGNGDGKDITKITVVGPGVTPTKSPG
jgi:hypothetical protein